MAYEKFHDEWKNKPDETTPVAADALDHIEDGLVAAAKTADDAKAAAADKPDWDDIGDKPSTFPPANHKHEIADVNGLKAALDGIEERLSVLEKDAPEGE